MLQLIARARANTRHFAQHREVLGIVDAVELGLVFRRNVELHDKEMSHDLRPHAIRSKMLCWRLVVCGRIFGFHSPRSEASVQAGLLITSAESTS